MHRGWGMENFKIGQDYLDEIVKPKNPFEGLMAMEVTSEIISKIADAKFAWLDLIVQGHMIAICAKPNGGKTTIMVHAAGEMSFKHGYQVIYINADASASDLKEYKNHAIDFGYKLLNPDLANVSAEDVVNELKLMSLRDYDLSNYVLILDTLKKFTDMMNKSKGKEFYSILRALTTKGMTVICLAHTNKYDDKDGKPVFEGVGDLRSDFDELIYLIPVKNDDGSITVSTSIDKCRAILTEYSFSISPDREVSVLNHHVDTLAVSLHQRHLEEDSDVIQFILENIQPYSKSVTELHITSKKLGIGFSRKRLDSVLKRYSSQNSKNPKWLALPAPTYGTKYSLITPEYLNELILNDGVKV